MGLIYLICCKTDLIVSTLDKIKMEMIKVVYNTTYGGFMLPGSFCQEFKEKYGEELSPYTMARDDERIIEMLEESDWFADSELAIKEIPAEAEWDLHTYDGMESITWHLPENKIIDDLRMILIGEATNDTIAPITKKFLDSGNHIICFVSNTQKSLLSI